MFEVGKKLRLKVDKGVEGASIWEVLYVASTFLVVRSQKSPVECIIYKVHYATYEEHKEPRTVTRWHNVWEKYDGTIRISDIHYETEAMGRSLINTKDDQWTYLDTIKLEWKEKV